MQNENCKLKNGAGAAEIIAGPFSPVPLDGALTLFHGAVSPAVARVYAQGSSPDDVIDNGLHLTGQLIGPQCEFAQTLPARMPFADRGPGQTLLAEAIVPDPCCWTPELPFTYRALVEVRRGEEVVQKYERLLGIRRWGVRGRDLLHEGKRFVLRGGQAPFSPVPQDEAMLFARETSTALLVSNPDNALCEFASRRGVMLIADLTASTTQGIAELKRLACWPSVAVALLPSRFASLEALSALPRNLLVAAYLSADEPLVLPDWAQLTFVETRDAEDFAQRTPAATWPIIAVRRAMPTATLEQSRAACDALQRDLAPFGDYAGYIA